MATVLDIYHRLGNAIMADPSLAEKTAYIKVEDADTIDAVFGIGAHGDDTFFAGVMADPRQD